MGGGWPTKAGGAAVGGWAQKQHRAGERPRWQTRVWVRRLGELAPALITAHREDAGQSLPVCSHCENTWGLDMDSAGRVEG